MAAIVRGVIVFMMALCSFEVDANLLYLTINTTALIGHPAGPFSLDIQFIDGSGTGDGNNAVAFTTFAFGGGGPLSTPILFGDASGDLSSSVILRDTQFTSEFTQQFLPGTALTMGIVTTSNLDSPAPDELSLSILDSTGTQIPTVALATIGSDVLFLWDLGLNSGPFVFRGDSTRTPAGGGPPIDLPSPVIGSQPPPNLPEPSSLFLILLGICLVPLVKNRYRDASN